MDKIEAWWSQWTLKEYIGPYDLHFLAIAVADIFYAINLREAVHK